ncbi:RepB family plasmid replication initiator protein [Ochrobactrum sp. CGA5]|uniref:RepB family plasmid replication initiator protein n=1 Tax=Ochrobactrum sp. CGA5 TaxID=2583453 RepID=UPI0011205F32|nr:RepB family plasmid replication initiator protein [Ochrobactrum sp. CGA5]
MNKTKRNLFKPSTRGDIISAIDADALSKVAPSRPRPVEMLESCEITSDDKLTASDTALHELMISTAYMFDPNLEEDSHTIPVGVAMKYFGVKETHADHRELLKLSLKRLTATTVSYGSLKSRRYENVPMLVSWLESNEASDNIRYSLPKPVRDLMRSMPSLYAYLELAPLATMRSKFSIRIYRVLAAAAVQKRWSPGGDNEIVLKATSEEIAAWCGFPRDIETGVNFGKLKERVLNGLEADLASIRRFKTKIIEVRKQKMRGRPLDHMEFRLELQAPSHHQTRVLFDAVTSNAGKFDVEPYNVADHIWLKAEKLFSKKLGFGHFQFLQLWLVALHEATTNVGLTSGFETRAYRGEKLLASIDDLGADEAAWQMISEEVASPDLAHADGFVCFLVAADKAEQARLARTNEGHGEIEEVVVQASEEAVLTPVVPVSTSLEGVSEIVLFADRSLTPQEVDDLIATPIISAVLGNEGDPMVNFTIRHWVEGDEMESFGLRPRRVNINEYNALIASLSRYLDREPEIVR